VAEKCQNINAKAQFESPKHPNQATFESYNRSSFETPPLGQNWLSKK
jgi:hypothetical protein